MPAALENQISVQNAGDVRSPVIVEVANNPVSAAADEILREREVVVVPDILASAGGVTVSYFEWTQNRTGLSWSLEDVHDRLRARMVRGLRAVRAIAAEHEVDLRTAACVHALNRLRHALEARGAYRHTSDGRETRASSRA